MAPTPESGPAHHHAALCAIGDEITLGQNVDTNSAWIADRLTAMGVVTVEHAAIPDGRAATTEAITRLAARAPLIICTGGLGPTPDDLTRHALADAMGEELVEDRDAIDWLEEFAAKLSKPLPESNRVQALRPVTATLIHNPHGTAPGIHARLRVGDRYADVYCLPGPPREMQPMFESAVAPAIDAPAEHVRTRYINTFGVGESAISQRLGELLARESSPTVGLTIDGIDVRFRIRAEGDPDETHKMVERAAERIYESMGDYAFSEGEQTLCETVLDALRNRDERLVAVESCTGGLLGATITEIPGSSDVFMGGWTTYSNAMKESAVRVPAVALQKFGAVSEPVARAMAEGGLLNAPDGGADHALALTGIAGPDGASDEKPVGTVFIARASRDDGDVKTQVKRFRFTGSRELVRKRAVQAALAMLRFHIIGDEQRPLLWEWPMADIETAPGMRPG